MQPVVNYGALKAGAETSQVIRDAARSIDLESATAVVRLTGEQPLADDEFASVEDGAALNGVFTLLAVLVILWLALRSKRMIGSVLVTLFVGLVVTAALGLAMVGSLNMISVAFMVLFVGLGVDFSIQYGVKYREELPRSAHRPRADRRRALDGHAARAGHRGRRGELLLVHPHRLSRRVRLGLIAGVGMFVALLTTITLLPALLRLFAPPGESKTPGFPWLAPVDDYLDRHRKPILIGTLVVVIGALPLLAFLRFDFNPLHLKDPNSESMATLLALKDSPEAAVNDVTLLAPSLAQADAAAKRLDALPEVGRTTTLSTFIPADQPAKRAAIAAAASDLLPALTQPPAPPATDAQRVAALKRVSDLLSYAAEDHPGAAAAQHLSASLAKLAAADAATRDRAERAFSDTLRIALNQLASLLQPQDVTRESLPPQIVRDWVAPDGHALVQISPKVPKGVDPGDDTMLRRFAKAVKAAEPGTTGGPISILHSADTIINAFLHAALWSIISITVLLWSRCAASATCCARWCRCSCRAS